MSVRNAASIVGAADMRKVIMQRRRFEKSALIKYSIQNLLIRVVCRSC